MKSTNLEFPALPAGFIFVKIGGRPKKEARDAAVFLAKIWRQDKFQEKSSEAEKWIVEKWGSLGTEASKGIGETAHVRAAIKRSRARGLNSSLLIFDDDGKGCIAVEVEKTATGPILKAGARAWIWGEGMAEAAEATIKNPHVTVHQDVMDLTPIAKAAVSVVRG